MLSVQCVNYGTKLPAKTASGCLTSTQCNPSLSTSFKIVCLLTIYTTLHLHFSFKPLTILICLFLKLTLCVRWKKDKKHRTLKSLYIRWARLQAQKWYRGQSLEYEAFTQLLTLLAFESNRRSLEVK